MRFVPLWRSSEAWLVPRRLPYALRVAVRLVMQTGGGHLVLFRIQPCVGNGEQMQTVVLKARVLLNEGLSTPNLFPYISSSSPPIVRTLYPFSLSIIDAKMYPDKPNNQKGNHKITPSIQSNQDSLFVTKLKKKKKIEKKIPFL